MTCCAVSIHARHYWRAKPLKRYNWTRYKLFQSTPAITGGRNLRAVGSQRWFSWFQSTPAITGGRDRAQVCTDYYDSAFQSTPAITGGRDQLIGIRCGPACRFNPRPPLLAGETPPRPFFRNMIAKFQSTPAITGGRDFSTMAFGPPVIQFQSTPAITGGRDRLYHG